MNILKMSVIEATGILMRTEGETLKAIRVLIDHLNKREKTNIQQQVEIDKLRNQFEKDIPTYEKEIIKLRKLVKYWEDLSTHLNDPDKTNPPCPEVFHEDDYV